MKFSLFGKVAGILALTVSLAGCFDVTSEIEVLSETNGKVTTTMAFGPDIWPMLKQMATASTEGGAAGTPGSMCPDGATLTENADGSAICTDVKEGAFDTLMKAEDGAESGDEAKFEVVSPGVVRVSFKTAGMRDQMAEGLGPEAGAQDEAAMAQMRPYFEGHAITMRIKGKSITDTNMTKSADGTSVELVIPLLDLLDKKVELPDEIYAVVSTN